MKLRDKVAVVTGTSPNIGGGIAECLAAAGAALVCVDSIADNSEDCARAIVKSGGRAIAVTCDVCDEPQVAAAIATACEAFGAVDILVNNAGIFNRKGLLDMPLDEWRRQTDIILTGTFLFARHAARSMIERGRQGSIVNIVSTAGHQGDPGNIAYCAAKGGLLNFTRAAAMELARHGIRVNSLTPTATDPEESFERAARWGRKPGAPPNLESILAPFRRGVPLRRLPGPSDYGRAVAFLASDDAAMITGVDLPVDAGSLARYWAWDPSAGA